MNASGASEPAAFNEVIDPESANAAADCLGMFTRLELIDSAEGIRDSFRNFLTLKGID
jgi:hypothetical protein